MRTTLSWQGPERSLLLREQMPRKHRKRASGYGKLPYKAATYLGRSAERARTTGKELGVIARYLAGKGGPEASSLPASKMRSPLLSDFLYFVTLALDVLS
ncbi:hypothetical protein E3N88_34795 [Mikania micrantha]|uniref:Uncharacterized protein n=1 Tax=Mikania micrantha TaxID=192012 RepID=A0A5N6LZ64_9ASTR|nr:hypothetical protein E3N88_34795 [Mikania micrantha]